MDRTGEPEGASLRRHSRNIQRQDRRGFHGFLVNLVRRGRSHSQFFSDRKHGGRAGAEAAAERWWREQARRLDPPIRTHAFRLAVEARRKGVAQLQAVARARLEGELDTQPDP